MSLGCGWLLTPGRGATRWDHGWELHIEGVGVTQSRTLWDAEDMARDLIARREDLPGDAFAVRISASHSSYGLAAEPPNHGAGS